MKYCVKCGNQLMDEAVICPKCGCPTAEYNKQTTPTYSAYNYRRHRNSSGMKTTIKVFIIISLCFYGISLLTEFFMMLLYVPYYSRYFIFSLIPLAWVIPMTVVYFKKVANYDPISTGFKVCYLLFVNLLVGILMLCDDDI